MNLLFSETLLGNTQIMIFAYENLTKYPKKKLILALTMETLFRKFSQLSSSAVASREPR